MPPQWSPAPPATGKGPLANLAARRAAGEIHADPVQEKIVLRLQAIYDQLGAMAAAPPVKTRLPGPPRLRPRA